MRKTSGIISSGITNILARLTQLCDYLIRIEDTGYRIENWVRDIPVHVDIDKRLAKAIVARLTSPLVISEDAADYLSSLAPHCSIFMVHSLGYGNKAGRLDYEIRPNGRIKIQLFNHDGLRIWQGELAKEA